MGFLISAHPTYLYQTPSGYIFRLRIPKDLKGLVGKTEFRYSLRTAGLRLAKHRARYIASFVHQLFITIRDNMSKFSQEHITELVKEHIRTLVQDDASCSKQTAMVKPGGIIDNGESISEPASLRDSNHKQLIDPAMIKQLAQQYIRDTLGNDEKCRAIAGTLSQESFSLEGLSILEASNMKAAEATSLLKSIERWLKIPDHSLMHPLTEKILNEQQVSADAKSETYKMLSRELLIAFQSVLRVRIKRSEGDYSQNDDELVPQLKQRHGSIVSPVEATVAAVETVKFSDIQARFNDENMKTGQWTENTAKDHREAQELFLEVFGDVPVVSIDRKLISRFRNTLLKLPPNKRKLKEYRDLSIEEILKLSPKKTLASLTVNKYLTRLGSLFNYAKLSGEMRDNPAEGFNVKIKVKAADQREAFTEDDLGILFGSPVYKNGEYRDPYRFWVPLIAVYSGCRLEEICQLHLEDIREEAGVWIFDINDKETDKSVKNLSATRLVPVHPDLIQLGLLQRVEALKKRGDSRLFPELKNTIKGKYGHYVGKWFATYLVKLGIKTKKKNFHSFRHTFITHLKHKKVDQIMLAEMVGHEVGGETMGRYGDKFGVKDQLENIVEKVAYGFDLDSFVVPDV